MVEREQQGADDRGPVTQLRRPQLHRGAHRAQRVPPHAQPDSGEVVYDGKTVTVGSPAAAQRLGIATVFQDLALCDNLDVVANLFLGQERGSALWMDEVGMEKEAWRLRDGGLGVILISHNMADVQAVADRIVVLRLGRNTAEFAAGQVTTDQLVTAITGASDNVVAARRERHAATPPSVTAEETAP